MSAHHGHKHDHHHHVPKSDTKTALATALTGGFMLAEITGGVISVALASLSDADSNTVKNRIKPRWQKSLLSTTQRLRLTICYSPLLP